MEWKKWNGEDIGYAYETVLLCLMAHYKGATYYWMFPNAYCLNGEWMITNHRHGDGDYLKLMRVEGDSQDDGEVKAYDPTRGDELYYTTLETPDGHKFSARFFKRAKSTGGILMSVYEGRWHRAD